MDPLSLALVVAGLALALGAGWALGRRARVGEAEARLEAAERRAEARRAEADTRHAEADAARAQVDAARTELGAAREELQRRRATLEARTEEARGTHRRDRETIEAARGRIAARTREIEARTRALDSALASVDALAAAAERRRADAAALAERIQARTTAVGRRQQELASAEAELAALRDATERQRARLDGLVEAHLSKLEAAGSLSRDEARATLVREMEREARLEAAGVVKNARDEARQTAQREATKLVLKAVQRLAAHTAIEHSVSPVPLPREDMKGRIIGREGRNIRAFEAATGVEVVVDDTPDAVLVSAFEPVRREVARVSMERLLADGRIHPARIEEVVAEARTEVEEDIVRTGEQAALELELHGLHPELVRLVGRMKYRASYGQNLLSHSMEVARLSSVMAAELGLDARKARRAGLLHDIGKVSEEPLEAPHAIVGMELARRYKEHPDIANAIGAHHDEVPMAALIAPVVQAADAVSGARPGARREAIERYVQRLQALEAIAAAFEGVQRAYAIQAGRELRVIVEPEAVSDALAETISRDIARRIESEVEYPGQIRVTVIRELRASSVAT